MPRGRRKNEEDHEAYAGASARSTALRQLLRYRTHQDTWDSLCRINSELECNYEIPDAEQLAKVLRGRKYRQNWRELFELFCILVSDDEIKAATSQVKEAREIRANRYFTYLTVINGELQALLDSGGMGFNAAWVASEPRVDFSSAAAKTPNGDKIRGEQKTVGQRPHVVMNAFAPKVEDDIRMRVETTEAGRVALEEIVYQLDDDREGAGERVCLRALEIVWNWVQSSRVRLDDGWTEPESRLPRMQQENPEVRILSVQRDTALLRVRVSHAKPGAVLSPALFVAVRRLLLPEASIMAAPEERHIFSVLARKGDLRIARRDGADGQFIEVATDGEELRSQARALNHAVRTLFVEISQRFPEEGKPIVLGMREAAATAHVEETM